MGVGSEFNEDGMTAKIAAVSSLQGIISRMSSNSQAMKNWAISIVSGFLAIKGVLGGSGCLFKITPIFICCVFSYLDAYYLSHEKSFRMVFNKITSEPVGSGFEYLSFNDTWTKVKVLKENGLTQSLKSPSVYVFYLSIALGALLIESMGR